MFSILGLTGWPQALREVKKSFDTTDHADV